jgi:hypothetical protein
MNTKREECCCHYGRCEKSNFFSRCTLVKGHDGEHRAYSPHELGDAAFFWKTDSWQKIIIIGADLGRIRDLICDPSKLECFHCQPFGNYDLLLSKCYLDGRHEGDHCASVPIEFDGSYPGDTVIYWNCKGRKKTFLLVKMPE